MALVGGVNLMLAPDVPVALSRAPDAGAGRPLQAVRRRAPTAMCRAEGCGVVVLKRLADAVRRRRPGPRA